MILNAFSWDKLSDNLCAVSYLLLDFLFMRLFFLKLLVFVIFVCGFVSNSYAQNLPGSADPGRFEDRFNGVSFSEDLMIKPIPIFSSVELMPEALDGFVLNGVEFLGVNAFVNGDFQQIIKPYIGRKVDLAILNYIATQITQYYHSQGYFLSRAFVEPQEVEQGIVKISVIEGNVNHVYFDDPDGLLANDILKISEGVKEKIESLRPLHAPTLERYMLLLNDGAGVVVQSILSASSNSDEVGAVDVVLKISQKNPSLSVGYNNYGSRFIGPHQADVEYRLGGVFSSYDQLSLQGVLSVPLKELQYGFVSYDLPLNEDGLRLNLASSYSNSEPGLNLEDLEVEGDSLSLEAGLSYPLIRSRRTVFNVGGSFILKNNAVEFLDSELIDDKIRYLSLYTNIQYLDQWNGVSSASASVSKGFNILEATRTGSDNLSRAQGRSDFVKVEARISRLQKLNENWSFFGFVEGQYAPHPLLSSQEFGYGGVKVGRAYDSSEITGDQGVTAGLELSYNNINPINALNFSITPFAFYDIGKVWNEDTGGESLSAASAGFGVDYQFRNSINGTLQVAWPLTKNIDTPTMGGGVNGPRFLFDIKKSF